jgi:hypothetical protein
MFYYEASAEPVAIRTFARIIDSFRRHDAIEGVVCHGVAAAKRP